MHRVESLTADGTMFLSGIGECNQEYVKQLHGSDDVSWAMIDISRKTPEHTQLQQLQGNADASR